MAAVQRGSEFHNEFFYNRLMVDTMSLFLEKGGKHYGNYRKRIKDF